MKVSSLQAFLRNLLPALDAVGGNAALRKGVEAVASSLEPFAENDFDQFAAFLSRAEEYHRTGVVPVVAAKARAARKPAASKVDLHALATRLAELRALGDEGPPRREEVEREWAGLALDKLKAADWVTLADSLRAEMPPGVKTAKDRARFVLRHVFRGFLPSARDLVAKVRAIEEAAATPESNAPELEARLDALDLSGYDAELLLEACAALGTPAKKKTKDAAIQAIRRLVTDRKTAQRVNLV